MTIVSTTTGCNRLHMHMEPDDVESRSLNWKKIYKTLLPIAMPPMRFWKPDVQDLIAYGAVLAVTLAVWTTIALTHSFDGIIAYWDGPNYLYAGATLYAIDHTNPWTRGFKFPPSYFACHLPGFPLLIRICREIVRSYRIGFYIAILAADFFFCYAFRRALVVTRCVTNPTYSTALTAVIPMRFVIYHSVGASEPLFLGCASLAFVFYKFNMLFPLLCAIWGACVTRIEGMAVGATFGLCYLLRFDILRALSMFLTFLAPAGLVAMHYWRFGDALAYIHFNQGHENMIKWPPFNELLGMAWQPTELDAHSFIHPYVFMVIGTGLVFTKSVPIGIFASIFAAYVAILFHLDLYRYGLPCSVFAYIIGFDSFLSSKRGMCVCGVCAPLYLAMVIRYANGQILSNAAWPAFMKAVFQEFGEVW